MESYLIHADELWAALPSAKQSKVAGGLPAFTQDIHSEINQWVRHGALWHAVNPLWDGLRAKGFKEALLDLQAAQENTIIQQTLQKWHSHLEPTQIFADFNGFHATATAEPIATQLNEWIHGKRRFRDHVVPKLNRLIEQQSAKDWFTDLLRTLNLPGDLNFLWAAMSL
jgi:hypothetical protein